MNIVVSLSGNLREDYLSLTDTCDARTLLVSHKGVLSSQVPRWHSCRTQLIFIPQLPNAILPENSISRLPAGQKFRGVDVGTLEASQLLLHGMMSGVTVVLAKRFFAQRMANRDLSITRKAIFVDLRFAHCHSPRLLNSQRSRFSLSK